MIEKRKCFANTGKALRINLPAMFVNSCGLTAGDFVEIEFHEGFIIVRPEKKKEFADNGDDVFDDYE